MHDTNCKTVGQKDTAVYTFVRPDPTQATSDTAHLIVKATGGGLGVKNHVWLFLKISWSRVRGKKPHQKILFVARDMIF